ncbi:hypothetical protein [Georgenia sp. SUBG003]
MRLTGKSQYPTTASMVPSNASSWRKALASRSATETVPVWSSGWVSSW